MFCSSCGAQLPDGVKYCHVCGAITIEAISVQKGQQVCNQYGYNYPASQYNGQIDQIYVQERTFRQARLALWLAILGFSPLAFVGPIIAMVLSHKILREQPGNKDALLAKRVAIAMLIINIIELIIILVVFISIMVHNQQIDTQIMIERNNTEATFRNAVKDFYGNVAGGNRF